MKSILKFLDPTEKHETPPDLKLTDGSRVGVIGGGPAGSFFSYFLLEMAQRLGIQIHVDIYEPRDFFTPSPHGCNMCGGIISETLVQMLATEGIILPPQIIQRGIDSYTLHTDKGKVKIMTPLEEKRIGAVHRGCGPKDVKETKWGSFDGFLQILAIEKGTHVYREKVTEINFENGRPAIVRQDKSVQVYDLLTVAVGVNSNALKLFSKYFPSYRAPKTTKTFIREFYLGEDEISKFLGNSMHIFLLDIPGLEFAAFIPKGDYVTLCMLGKDIDNALLEKFLSAAEVKQAMPAQIYKNLISCRCNPKINVGAAIKPFADRLVFVGDCGITRLYKDGIGAAYRMAKIAATTAVFEGVSENEFAKFYWPACKNLIYDNMLGKIVFKINKLNQKISIARSAILKTVIYEQKKNLKRKYMSNVLWDMFTGSATYRDIFLLTLHPIFLYRYMRGILSSLIPISNKS